MMATRSDSLNLTEQLNQEWQRSGLSFRIMLIGESGLGKTTFTRALLRPYVPDHVLHEPSSAAHEPVRARTTEIHEVVHQVQNDGFPVEFTIIDCPGFGDAMDSTSWIDKIVGYIQNKFAEHYDALGSPPKQSSAPNGLQRDGLVHVCLYFIAAHRLKGVDLEFMRRLEPHVNLVPVIAKADTMTLAERDAFRRLVVAELRACGVKTFQLSDMSSAPPSVPAPQPPGSAHAANGTPMADRVNMSEYQRVPPPPFAVCASEDGTRAYPWGTCLVEDPAHSDLSLLRQRLFSSSLITAKRATLELYETSYAQARRQREANERARQARALWRERLLTRAVLGLAASSAAVAAACGALHAVGLSEWAEAAKCAMLKPRETAVAAYAAAEIIVRNTYESVREAGKAAIASARVARAYLVKK